jgi:16S rRNA (guanine527-N7)-methyltransferase
VVQARAEEAGRDPGFRACFDIVVARSFGRPGVVAECAAPLLARGGWLVVSEPPPSDHAPGPTAAPEGKDPRAIPERWPDSGLALLGLETVENIRTEFEYRVLRQRTLCPDRYPRRNGVPAKKPLF